VRKLIVGNWKMNPNSLVEARRLFNSVAKAAKRFQNVDVVLCPPFPYLAALRPAPSALLGAQDVFWEEKGAFTGEISPRMLKSSEVSYVIIGHSERRRHLGETDEMINKKVLAALKNGLRVILCVGETLSEKRRGQTKAVLRRQLQHDLASLRLAALKPSALIIAYEPIWAIGTGVPETPFSANEASRFIRKATGRIISPKVAKNIRILYGGSTNSRNIFGYLIMPELSGALVGGASLDAKDFTRMLEIANLL